MKKKRQLEQVEVDDISIKISEDRRNDAQLDEDLSPDDPYRSDEARASRRRTTGDKRSLATCAASLKTGHSKNCVRSP